MTASKLLSVSETLALFDRLRQATRDAATRAGEIERDFAINSNKLDAQLEQAMANERARGSSEAGAAQMAAAASRERVKSVFAARQARIAKALESTRKRKLAEIESVEGKRTFEIQRDLLEADRTRDTDGQKNKSAYEAFIGLLAEERAALEQLEAHARSTLRGFRALTRLLDAPPQSAPLDVSAHENRLIEQLRNRLETSAGAMARCRGLVLPLLFGIAPLWLCFVLVLLAPLAFVPALRQFDLQAVSSNVWQAVGAAAAAVFGLYLLGRLLARPAAEAAAVALHEARTLHDVCAQKADASFGQERDRIRLAHGNATQLLNSQWKQVREEAGSQRNEWARRFEEQARNLDANNQERKRRRLEQIEKDLAVRLARIEQESAGQRTQLETARAENLAKLNAAHDAARSALELFWRTSVLPLSETLRMLGSAAERLFPPWQTEAWQPFTLPHEFAHAAKFAELQVDLEKACGVSVAPGVSPGGKGAGQAARNEDPDGNPDGKGRPSLPAKLPATTLTLPLLLSVPRQASVLFETKQIGHEQIIGALNNLVLRLLTSSPPGRLSFTLFDPVGLGQNFAGLMHLADFEERLINSRIWTQTAQFEQRLADLNEHIEKVTQMYLRNEYQTLAEYNAQAGRMAERYHFLVIADFPANFSELAVKRLLSIVASGPRCGVHTLIHWDQRRLAPVELVPDELRRNAICIVPKGDGFLLANSTWEGAKLLIDAPPSPELTTVLLQQIGQQSTDSFRVEMPFAEIVPEENRMWCLDTTHELRVPIGRTGATKLQHLALGQGTRQHGLIAGKTGSGKSTLFHVIITNLALWCSPEQVEFYLVDFKKGVEFKCYASHRLPHARVVAIESDREFGLSVLQRVDEELKHRGDLFRRAGAQDLPGYKRAGGTEPIPRSLLIIDEFQEFFVEDDRIAQSAALLLDRVVRQGRAFGIHVLLGSQTLGGAYTLARATIGQMVVRIALQCNEADALLIMNEDNPAPRLLSRPGEAIYNDDGGAIQGNSPFQVVWLPDDVRESWLKKSGEFAKRRHFATKEPIVFEGNAPANVRDNPMLLALLNASAVQPVSAARIWLGAPNSIKAPTEAVFRRQSGSHLLIVGQREEAALGLLALALVALAAQHPKPTARFLVFDGNPPESRESRFLEHAVQIIPHGARLVRGDEIAEVMAGLAADMERWTESAAGEAVPATYLLIHGLQSHRKLRFDEELSFSMDADAGAGHPGLLLNKLICEGASAGFHVIGTCDTYNNVMRSLSRKALSEFEMRIVFQMSANDSASLIDTPAANNLGLHRAIFFNGHEGWIETFRPYALSDDTWLAEAGRKLARLQS